MADIESNIDINIDTSDALASLRALQRQISVFHQSMAKSQAVSNGQLAQMQQNLVNGVNATGNFTASIQRVKTTTESFTNALEKNKLSMGQYFRYAGAATQGFGRLFKNEFDTIEKVARERVKTLQTQYIKLGRDASGAMQAIAVRPQVLDMKDLGTQTAITAQKAQLFNQLMAQGSTNLLNFGKNTQWAGRQLMVGFTIPLGVMGAAAAREFMKMEEQVIRFQRVYGDFSTSAAQTEQMTSSIKDLASEYTKYGIAVSKTMGLAADAAAMGKTGAALTAQVAEATRLAVLGGVEQAQALETTTSLTNAFGIAADKLAGKINFLNAVENQTVTSIQDLTQAIPTAGPVVQQLGGSVEDLAFFMTAMKEGGIDAGEGANALKSGLASIINPTEEAKTMLEGFNISIENLVTKNAGNARGMVLDLASALNGLDPLNRAQAIETMFGKFQFARMSTLFQNVVKEGSQASRVLELTKNSATELAMLSERELAKVAASPMYKFQKAMEDFKASLAPVGEEFLKAVTPIISFGTEILKKFNEMGDGSKQLLINIVGLVAGIGPVLLMGFGLISNGVANLLKGFLFIRNVFSNVGNTTNVLTNQLNYMTDEQQQAAAVAASLGQVHQSLIQTFTAETGAVNGLAGAYRNAIAAQGSFTGPILTSGGGTRRPGVKKFASGGMVPGSGNGDTVPSLLTPGEIVVPKKAAQQYGGIIMGMIAGNIEGFATGGYIGNLYPEYALRMQNAAENMSQQAGKTNLASVLAPMSLRAGEAQGILPTQGAINAGKFDQIAKELEKVAQDFVDEVNKNFDKTYAHIEDTDERFARSWTDAGKAVEKEVNKIENEASKGAVRKVFGLDEDVYGTAATDVRRAGDSRLSRGRKSVLDTGVRSYTSIRPAAKNMYSRLSGDTTSDMQMGHVFGPREADLAELAKSSKATPALKRAMQKLGITIVEDAATAINTASGAASPAKKFVAAAGKNIVDGALQPIEKAGRRASMAGSAIAAGATQGSLDAEKRGRVSSRASTGFLAYDVVSGQYIDKAELDKLKADRKARGRERARGIAAAERKSAIASKVRGMASPGRLAGAGMAASGIAMGASMMGGPIGQMANQVMGPIMAISGVASVLSMIPGPAGLVVAGLLAAVAGFTAFNVAMDNARNKGAELAESMSMTKSKMDALSSVTGKEATSTVEQKKRSDSIANIRSAMSAEDTDALSQFKSSFAGSDIGKTFVQDVKNQISNGTAMSDVAKNISTQLASAVAEGVLSKNQADAIAETLGESIKSKTFTIQLKGELSEILGPNGEKISTPGAVANAVTQRSNAQAGQAAALAQEKQVNPVTNNGAGAAAIAGGALAIGGISGAIGGAAALGTALAWNPVGWGILAVAGIAAVTAGIVGMVNAQAENVKNATMATDMYAKAYQQNLNMTDVIKDQYGTLIANKQALLDSATTDEERKRLNTEIKALQDGQTTALERQKAASKTLVENAVKTKEKLGETTWDDANKKQIEQTYKDDTVMQELAKKQYTRASDESVIADKTTQAKLELQIASGALDPTAAETLLNALSGNTDLQAKYKLLIEKTGDQETLDMITSLTAAGADEKTLQVQLDVVAGSKDPKAAMAELNKISKLAAQLNAQGIDININEKGAIDRLRALSAQLAQVDTLFANTSPITADVIMSTFGLEMTQSAMDYFNSLPPADQKTYTTAYLTVYKAIDANTESGKKELEQWASSNGGLGKYQTKEETSGFLGLFKGSKTVTNYEAIARDQAAQAATQAVAASQAAAAARPTPPPVNNAGPSGGGGGGAEQAPEKAPASFLDSIVKSLRDVRIAGQGLTEDFESSWSAINAMFGNGASLNLFGGLQQQMRNLGAGEDLINLIAGMSPEEFEKHKNEMFNFDSAGNITGFKDMLGSIGRALKSIALGDFQNKQKATTATTLDQIAAVKKLTEAGVDSAAAYDLVSDAATANAIANETNANTLRDVAAAANEAAAAQTQLATAQSLAAANKNTKNTRDIVSFLEQNAGKLTEDQTAAILSDQTLQDSILNMIRTGNFNVADMQTAFANAANQAKLDLRIDRLTIPGMEKMFSEGMSRALEQVDFDEKKLKLKFETDTKDSQKEITAAQQKIEDIKNQKDGMDDLEADLTRINDKEIDINKKYADRFKAMDQIEAANNRISNRQRAQITIADALASGDIGAAAAAAQQLRAEEAAQALSDRRAAMERARDLEVSQLTGNMGLTKTEIEEKLRKIKMEIFEIEEKQIEPAQRAIDLKQRDLDIELEKLDKIKKAWEEKRALIDAAKLSSDGYAQSIANALNVMAPLEAAYGAANTDVSASLISGYTTTTTTPRPTTTAAPVTAAPAPAQRTQTVGRWPNWDGSLWGIAAHWYGDGNQWRKIYNANTDKISNPNLIYPGQELVIPYSKGGKVGYFAKGGMMPKIGTDTVPAMLTPGEFVVKKFAVDNFGAANLEAINNGTYEGGSVYNNVYNLSVNVKSESDPNAIAKTVMAQIRNVDSQRVRGNRF